MVVSQGRVAHKKEFVSLAGATARIETTGDINRRITATRLMLTGPFAFPFKKRRDERTLYLTVEGDEDVFMVEVRPKYERYAHEAVTFINKWARRVRPVEVEAVEAPPAPALPPPVDPLDRLAKLVSLRDAGVLTQDEFTAQKAKILGT